MLTDRPDIDTNNVIRQRSGNNGTDGWTEGSLAKANLTAWNGDLVGLAACDSAINETIPLRLFYASNSTAFDEYLYFASDDKWVWQQTWNGYSGAADVGCFGTIDGYRYVGLVSTSNELEFWYQAEEDISADWQQGESSSASQFDDNPANIPSPQPATPSHPSTRPPPSPSPSTTPSTKKTPPTRSKSRKWTGKTSTPAARLRTSRLRQVWRAFPARI